MPISKGTNSSQRGRVIAASLLASASAFAILFTAAPAFAQSSAGSTDARRVDEIVVTARKVEESLQDAPISIAAYTAESLDRRGIQDLTEIARATAGFAYEDFNGAFGAPTIRAQSQARLTNPVQNVSSFYNGIYLQRSYMIDQSLLNIGQVEILRGPQSASVGRNAFAGAISYTSKRAGDEVEFGIDVGAGEDDFRSVKAEAAVPLVGDRFGLTAGYSYSEYDGGHENNHPLADDRDAQTRGNVGGYENESYSIGVNFAPTDKVTGSLNYLNNSSDQESPAVFVLVNSTFDSPIGLLNCGADAPFGGYSLFCGEIPSSPINADSTRNGNVRPDGIVIDPQASQSINTEIFSASLEYEFTDQLSVSYLYGRTEGSYVGGGASNFDQLNGGSGFTAGSNSLSPIGNGFFESDSHEVRLTYSPSAAITAYVGGYISDSTDENLNAGGVSVPATTTGPLIVPVFPDRSTFTETQNDVQSVFGFISYDTGPFSFSAEGRFTDEEVFDPVELETVDLSVFTPRLTAGYEINDSSRVYASFSQGTKIGGLNAVPAGGFVDPTQRFFDEETNTTYEIGSRNEFLGGDLVFNLTGFYIDAEDLQVNEARVLAADDTTTVAPAVVGNLGGSETFGFEVEANWYPSDNLAVYGSYGYADAEFIDDLIDQRIVALSLCDDVVCNANGDIGGNTLPRAPSSTLSAGFFWEDDFANDMAYFIGGDVGYQSKQFGNTANTFTLPDRTIVDASIGLRKAGFEVKLSADNLFDEEYASNAFDIAFGTSRFFGSRSVIPNLGDRRLVKVSLSYDY